MEPRVRKRRKTVSIRYVLWRIRPDRRKHQIEAMAQNAASDYKTQLALTISRGVKPVSFSR
ncbi:protein of unknown function [Paraburkholderia dioscoreae]|uniref:Uncharacterized protein n=1 Tax=Paraburkholderia dioscoreae TaxID=2604047 RepID=A0A5Q4ZKJ0_9BURK|nr:protein of unknown function [Paraburkholderia dioscoreae]